MALRSSQPRPPIPPHDPEAKPLPQHLRHSLLAPGPRLPLRLLGQSGFLMYNENPAATMDGWLRSPALDNHQELEFHFGPPRPMTPGCFPPGFPPPPLPATVRRFSSTLRVASFGGCTFPDGNNDGALHLPLLKQLSLLNVRIAEESSLFALLDGCPVLESLLVTQDIGCSRIRIVSGTIRSIGVRPGFGIGGIMLQQLVVQDAPCLERLIICGTLIGTHRAMVISVISAPKLCVLGRLLVDHPKIEFGTTTFQGSHVVKSTTAVNNVKVLALTHINLSLGTVVNFMKCLPCLKKLYIKMSKQHKRDDAAETNVWCRKYRNLTSTLDICLKEIVLTTYRGNKGHVNFAKFFVLNARVLESMVLQVDVINDNSEWIERQHKLLQITSRASRDARFHFVSHRGRPKINHSWDEKVHDLSMADPFVGFHKWA
ncbi:hypothetical protein EJB05_13992 [Eragrostis curvula]|uniref:Uncharacterized protein n=1 Tax=Eragrostis curvula TaxID=38414 RepID=A0A5J9VY14_9POAL|nr:hypothetical protein EJB05_13992 [Eragrostis curvula]